MKHYIVTLSGSGSPRSKYGKFIWTSKFGCYAWRGEAASSMEKLSELFTEAAGFLRSQANYYLELKGKEVPAATELPVEKETPAAPDVPLPIPEPPKKKLPLAKHGKT